MEAKGYCRIEAADVKPLDMQADLITCNSTYY